MASKSTEQLSGNNNRVFTTEHKSLTTQAYYILQPIVVANSAVFAANPIAVNIDQLLSRLSLLGLYYETSTERFGPTIVVVLADVPHEAMPNSIAQVIRGPLAQIKRAVDEHRESVAKVNTQQSIKELEKYAYSDKQTRDQQKAKPEMASHTFVISTRLLLRLTQRDPKDEQMYYISGFRFINDPGFISSYSIPPSPLLAAMFSGFAAGQ